jgi:type IV pilus assembly protein PilB
MGIEPFLLASTLEGVLAQRLVRRLCPACRAAYKPTEALLHQLGVEPGKLAGREFYRAPGCAACNLIGYKGRIGLFEYLPMCDALREAVVQGVSLVELRQKAVAQGMTSLREAGLAAILAGETTVEEMVRYT